MIPQLPNFNLIFPELSVLVMGCITLLCGLRAGPQCQKWVYGLAQLTLCIAFGLTLMSLQPETAWPMGIFHDMLVIDKLGYILKLVMYVMTFVIFVLWL